MLSTPSWWQGWNLRLGPLYKMNPLWNNEDGPEIAKENCSNQNHFFFNVVRASIQEYTFTNQTFTKFYDLSWRFLLMNRHKTPTQYEVVSCDLMLLGAVGYIIHNPYTHYGKFWKSVPQRGCKFSKFALCINLLFDFWITFITEGVIFHLEVLHERIYLKFTLSCKRCFINLPQGMCGIQ